MANSAYLQVMMGGQWFTDLFGEPADLEPSRLQDKALSDLQEHLGITTAPSVAHTSVHVVGRV